MDDHHDAPHSPAFPQIERPLHPTKTIFDKTKLSVEGRRLKTTTYGINRAFRLNSTRQNCAIRDPLSRWRQNESRSPRSLFGARLHPAFEDYRCRDRVDRRLSCPFLYRHSLEVLLGFETCSALVDTLALDLQRDLAA